MKISMLIEIRVNQWLRLDAKIDSLPEHYFCVLAVDFTQEAPVESIHVAMSHFDSFKT